MEWLTNLDGPIGLLALAVIAFLDTLIGIGLFVFGELAFLAAGAGFTANGAVTPIVIVLLFAWIGDLTSYALGRFYGPHLAMRFMNNAKRRKAWRRAEATLQQRGLTFVVLSRLLGPVASVTPFLAGTLGMGLLSFAGATALGVVIGVGQFLVFGAVGLTALSAVLPHLASHLVVLLLLAAIIFSGVYLWRRSAKPYVYRIINVVAAAAAIFFAANFLYFFVLNTHPAHSGLRPEITDVCHVAGQPLRVYPGQSSLHLPQPVNVLLVSKTDGADLMVDLGWHRNVTYSHDNVGFVKFLSLLVQRTPPISELYWNQSPADSAFQMSGSVRVREHVRWWAVGNDIHLGALSKTDEIAIKYYGHLPAILHDIDPKVDLSRDLLAEQVQQSTAYEVVGIAPIADPVVDGVISDFETDGGVLVIAERGYALPRALKDCLQIKPFA